jgi:DNA-3-methyladenine glycosylase II
MEIFKYGQFELDYLKKKDKILGLAIERIGMVEREVIPDLFAALVNGIVGQQISSKAAATVWNRLQKYFGEISPQIIASATVEEIQQCGLSTRKAGYIKGIGEHVMRGVLNLSELYELPDTEVIKRLSSLHGIGVWTAEMLLISSMERPDVVSWGDLAIRRGMINLYGLKTLTKEQFDGYKKRYSPYGSVASLYLWTVSKN